MEISEDETDYIDQVLDRCRKLIHSGIWEGIKEERLDGWFGSLRNCDAELLAAYLLDNLAFRSRDQYAALLDAIFIDLTITSAAGGHGARLVDELVQSKSSTSRFNIKMAPVIGHAAPPTKSGPYILRLAQRRYRINNDWLSWPHLLVDVDTISHLYLVDDFCGTGEQFTKFLKSIHLDEILKKSPGIKITYLVTTIHTDGLERITKEYPFVTVIWAERLGSVNAALSAAALGRYQVTGFSDKILNQYANAIKHTGLPGKGRVADGYGGLGLAYGFTHATPNNTLPIFWMATPKLTPLLDR